MKRFNRAIAVITVLCMLLSSSVFAAIPNNSVVVGANAYDLSYANTSSAAQLDIVSGIKSALIKISGVWLKSDGTQATQTDVAALPQITYTNAQGTQNYESGDGPQVTSEYQIQIANAAELLSASQARNLKADGETVMQVKANILKNGVLDENFAGQAEFYSKLGFKAAQNVAAFDGGIAVFNVTLHNSTVDLLDTIKISMNSTNVDSAKGLVSSELALTYAKYEPKPDDPTQDIVYTVDSVKSADLADRVNIYVSGVSDANLINVEKAIVAQLKLYNDEALLAPIDVVAVENRQVVDTAKKAYVWTAVLDGYEFNNAGYAAAADEESARLFLGQRALEDNQYNYWSVAASTQNVRLREVVKSATAVDQNFMLIDKTIPRIEDVRAPKKLVGSDELDKTYLDFNMLVAVFSESVNRLTAEEPQNWVLNGHKLEAADVRYIRVLDINSEEDADGKTLLAYKAVDSTRPRNNVVIKLTSAAANKYLKNGENLLQARSIADIAGLTDLSDNNKITTQDFLFNYDKPAAPVGIAIVKESPEQYSLSVSGLYTDADATTPYVLSTTNAKAELLSEPLRALVADVTVDSRIVGLPEADTAIEGNAKYILELTRDWTKILVAPTTYHNKWFRVTITSKVYDEYGNVKFDPATGTNAIYAEVQVPEDTQSPSLATKKDTITYIGGAYNATKAMAVYDATYGHMTIKMTEPVQLYDENDVSFMEPVKTPSTLQEIQAGVPMPAFEYVKVDTTATNPLYSVGKKIDGELYTTAAYNEHDVYYSVMPKTPLDEGQWKLVVRATSDDVGNTMSTEEIPFQINKEVAANNMVNPYVVWAYADDDRYVDANNNGKYDAGEVINDYVYVLYSREMSVDAIRSATYDVNGKQLNQDADITTESYIGYRVNNDVTSEFYNEYYGAPTTKVNYKDEKGNFKPAQWKPQLVTIKLPADFIVGGDDLADFATIDPNNPAPALSVGDRDGKYTKNVLTIPKSLTAVSDGVTETVETIKLDNNNNSNQFELVYDKAYGVNGYKKTSEIGFPAITYAPNAKIVNSAVYNKAVNNDNPVSTEIAITPASQDVSAAVGVNATANVTAEVSGVAFTVTSSNTAVATATVDANGVVTIVPKSGGTAVLTVSGTKAGFTVKDAKINVSVTGGTAQPAEVESFVAPYVDMLGKTTVTITIKAADANAVTGVTVKGQAATQDSANKAIWRAVLAGNVTVVGGDITVTKTPVDTTVDAIDEAKSFAKIDSSLGVTVIRVTVKAGINVQSVVAGTETVPASSTANQYQLQSMKYKLGDTVNITVTTTDGKTDTYTATVVAI